MSVIANPRSTISLLKAIQEPVVSYIGLVALGSTDYPNAESGLNPPATFNPKVDPNSGERGVPGTAFYDTYYQNIYSDSSVVSTITNPITNRWFLTLTDVCPSIGLNYNVLIPTGLRLAGLRFPNKIKVGGWIAGYKEGWAWRIVKIYDSATIGEPNCYLTPGNIRNAGQPIGNPVTISNTIGLPTYVPTDSVNTSGCVTLLLEDVGFYNLMLDNGKTGAPVNGANNAYIYFELNTDGIPSICPSVASAIQTFKNDSLTYYNTIIFNIMARFSNAGAYEDNIPVIQAVNNFKIGDAIAPLSITFQGTVARSTLTVTTPPTIPLPPGTRLMEATHIFHSSLKAGSYILEQRAANTYTINTDVVSGFSGTFSYINFVQANASTFTSTTNAIGIVTGVNKYSFQILSTATAYSSSIISPFTYKAFGNFYRSIPFSTFALSSLTGIQIGSQLAVNSYPSAVPALTINDQFIVTSNKVSTIQWLYLGQDILTGDDTGILNPFGGGGSAATAGGGDSGGIYGSAWFEANLTSPPPAPVSRPSVVSATSIILPWTYPTQTTVGFTSAPLPYLSSINVDLVLNISTGNLAQPTSTINIPLISGGTSSDFINQGSISTAITAVILQSQNATPPSTYISTLGLPTYSPPIRALIVANGIFSSISSSLTANYLNVFYNNFTSGSNVTRIGFTSTFTAPGPPATFSGVGSIVASSSSLTLNLIPPTFTDTVSQTNVASITSTILSISTLASALPPRAGPQAAPGTGVGSLPSSSPLLSTVFTLPPFPTVLAVPDSILNAGAADPSLEFNSVTTNFAPGTPYNFTVGTVNSLGLSTATTSALATSTFTTPPVPLPRTPSQFSTMIRLRSDPSRFCSTIYPIYNISTSSTIKNLISTTTAWSSFNIQTPMTPLYGVANGTTPFTYANSFYDIQIDINSTITVPGTTSVRGSGLLGWNATGFPTPATSFTSTLTTLNGIALRMSTLDTYYFAPITYQGFYHSASVDFTITPAAFNTGSLVISPNPLMVNMRQYSTIGTAAGNAAEAQSGVTLQYGTGAANAPKAISSSTFYYNGSMQNPIISTIAVSFSGVSSIATGVTVYRGGSVILSTSTSSINGFFYTQPILSYTSESFKSTIILNDFYSTVGTNAYLTAGFPIRGPIPDINVFSLTEQLNLNNNAYVSTLGISTIAFNPIGSTISTVSLNVMFDPLTVSTLNNLPTTVQTISAINTFGMLTVLSTVHPSSMCPPYYTGPPKIYAHTSSIASTPATDYSGCLQLATGSFVASSTMTKFAFGNYNGTLGNTYSYQLDGIQCVGSIYTGQSGGSGYTNNASSYRFANFVWRLPINQVINSFTFTLNNMKNVVIKNIIGPQIFGTPYSAINEPPVIMNMRLDDTAYPNIDFNGLIGSTTPWLNVLRVTGSRDYSELYNSQSVSGEPNSYTTEIRTVAAQGGVETLTSTITDNITNIHVSASINGLGTLITTNQVYLYLLIGLPIRKSISFDNVTAYYS